MVFPTHFWLNTPAAIRYLNRRTQGDNRPSKPAGLLWRLPIAQEVHLSVLNCVWRDAVPRG
jgi:hypothetical protein